MLKQELSTKRVATGIQVRIRQPKVVTEAKIRGRVQVAAKVTIQRPIKIMKTQIRRFFPKLTSLIRKRCVRPLMDGVYTRKRVFLSHLCADIKWWWTRTTRRIRWQSARTYRIFTTRSASKGGRQLTKWTTTLISINGSIRWMATVTQTPLILQPRNSEELTR